MTVSLPARSLSTLLANVPAFAFALRPGDLGLLSITNGVKSLTGFEARDLLASPGLFASRLLPEGKDALARLCAAKAEVPALAWEFAFRCADGKARWFRGHLARGPGPPGDPEAVVGIALPVEEERTARRKMSEAVSILTAAGAVIFFAGFDGIVRHWNDASEHFFGWSRQEMIGTDVRRIFPLPPEVVDSMIRTVRGGMTISQESQLRTKSGGEIDCRITVSRVADGEGNPAGMVVTVLGTEERKSLEGRLQQLVTRLRTIERVNRVIASDWDIGKVHSRIAGELTKLIAFDRTSIAVFEGDDSVLIHAHSRENTGLGTGKRVTLDRSGPGWVLAHRMARLDEDVGAAPEQFPENRILLQEGMRSRLLVPLFAGDRIVGTLNFNSRRKGAYSLSTVERLGTIPDQMAMAIEKYRMVDRLRSSEEKYRLLFEEGPPTATVGPDGRFLDVNEAQLRLYGYTREEFLGLAVSDLSPPEEEGSPYETVLRTGLPSGAEVRQKRKDGTVFRGLQNIFPVSPHLVVGQIIDITGRKEVEEALRREMDFSSRILEVANVLIIVLDREGRILLFNRKCEEVTGWTENEVRGKRIRDLLPPDHAAARTREEFDPAGGNAIPFFENPWITRDGKERNIRWNHSITMDDRGEVALVIGSGIDVTEQMQLEEQLRHIQKMEAVGTLAGGIAHDFNNIIQAIMGYTAVLRARAGEGGFRPQEIDGIEQAGLRASELTTQLLGFARGGKYEVRPVDLNRVVEKVVSMIRHTFDRSIEIRTDLAKGLAAVEGDAGQLEQTVLNLCINARDAMPDGGVLTLATRHEAAPGEGEGETGTGHGTYVCLALHDTGIGIPPENIPRIFEPFFTTKEPGKGSGMGLAMAYGIVKNHGGTLAVRSAPGEGSQFRIRLPASGEWAFPASATDADESAARGTETVLFVDDEESLRLLAKEMLRGLGYRVITAGNGIEAVRTFSENRGRIAVVILDMIMPGMGGEEAFHRLREIDPSVRVLLSSGYAVEGKPQSLLASGAAGFLQKPYRLAALASALRRIIGDGGP